MLDMFLEHREDAGRRFVSRPASRNSRGRNRDAVPEDYRSLGGKIDNHEHGAGRRDLRRPDKLAGLEPGDGSGNRALANIDPLGRSRSGKDHWDNQATADQALKQVQRAVSIFRWRGDSGAFRWHRLYGSCIRQF